MDFEFDKNYPAEYSYVEDLVQVARKQIMDLYEASQSLPDKGVKSAFDTPQNGEWRFGKRQHLVDALESARYAYARDIMDWVAEQVRDEDPKIAAWVRVSARTDIFSITGEKDFPDKSDVSDNKTSRSDTTRVSPPDQTVTEKTHDKNPTLATRFAASLSFNKARTSVETTQPHVRKVPPDKDRD